MNRAFSLCFALALACGGSSGPSPDSLFGPPTDPSTTPDSIYGLWGGSADVGGGKLDFRVDIQLAEVTFANRCTFENGAQSTVGVTVAASVTSSDIVVKESKSDASGSGLTACRVDATPVDVAAQLSGTHLTLSFPDGSELSLVKLSD